MRKNNIEEWENRGVKITQAIHYSPIVTVNRHQAIQICPNGIGRQEFCPLVKKIHKEKVKIGKEFSARLQKSGAASTE